MKDRCLKHKDALVGVLSSEHFLSPNPIIVGFDPLLVNQNLKALNQLIAGKDSSSVCEEMKISPRDLSRIALRFSRLKYIKTKLVDATSSVDLPAVWAPNFIVAAKHLKRAYCGALELPGWVIEGPDGNKIPLWAIV